jgi:hypothetical protein
MQPASFSANDSKVGSDATFVILKLRENIRQPLFSAVPHQRRQFHYLKDATQRFF